MNEDARTVFGIALEPGERVVYFHRSDPGWQKPALIVLGVITLIAIIGLLFLIAGLTAGTTCYVITTRRFLVIKGSRLEQLRHEQVVKVTKKIKQGQLRWIDVESAAGGPWVSYHAAFMPEIVPLLDRFVADRKIFANAPTVAFDAQPGKKPA